MESEAMIEKEHEINIIVTELGVMGYGNAESTISREKQLETGELSGEVDKRA